MSCSPVEPDLRHVWVLGHGGYGSPAPGVVVTWQRAPVHNASAAGWVALVATCPFDSAVLVEWVGAERLVAIRDHGPADEP